MKNIKLSRLIAVLLLALVAVACDSRPEATTPAATKPTKPAPEATEPAMTARKAAESTIEEQVSGLWFYTGLTTGDGTDLPLTGVFLFKDGVFLQQAVFNEGPLEEAGSMAHAGPYNAEPATASVHLVAEQTISVDPTKDAPISFRPSTDHDVTVSRDADALTLIFGMGTSTVQEFSYVGPGNGEVYGLENGALAFVDDYFILVDGNNDSVTSSYGTYKKQGDAVTMNVIRWSEADSSSATNLKDTVVQATFDGQVLVLADGREFKVAPD